MPEQETVKRARRDAREGKAPSTQAGEFVHEEIEHVREGKHGARSAKRVIAIGLSKARRAGVKVKPPKKGTTSAAARHKADEDSKSGSQSTAKRPSVRRSRAISKALKREGHESASPTSLASQARSSASRRTAMERSAAAKRASRTKGPAERSAAAKKAARTRARHK